MLIVDYKHFAVDNIVACAHTRFGSIKTERRCRDQLIGFIIEKTYLEAILLYLARVASIMGGRK